MRHYSKLIDGRKPLQLTSALIDDELIGRLPRLRKPSVIPQPSSPDRTGDRSPMKVRKKKTDQVNSPEEVESRVVKPKVTKTKSIKKSNNKKTRVASTNLRKGKDLDNIGGISQKTNNSSSKPDKSTIPGESEIKEEPGIESTIYNSPKKSRRRSLRLQNVPDFNETSNDNEDDTPPVNNTQDDVLTPRRARRYLGLAGLDLGPPLPSQKSKKSKKIKESSLRRAIPPIRTEETPTQQSTQPSESESESEAEITTRNKKRTPRERTNNTNNNKKKRKTTKPPVEGRIRPQQATESPVPEEIVSLTLQSSRDRQNPLFIDVERLETSTSASSISARRAKIGTLDVMKHLVQSFKPESSVESNTLDENTVHSNFKIHVLYHLRTLLDTHSSIGNLSQQINSIQRKKEALRQQIYELRNKHTDVGNEMNDIRLDYQNEKLQLNKLHHIEENIDKLKASIETNNTTPAINDEVHRGLQQINRIINPRHGITQKLILINEKLTKIETGEL